MRIPILPMVFKIQNSFPKWIIIKNGRGKMKESGIENR